MTADSVTRTHQLTLPRELVAGLKVEARATGVRVEALMESYVQAVLPGLMANAYAEFARDSITRAEDHDRNSSGPNPWRSVRRFHLERGLVARLEQEAAARGIDVERLVERLVLNVVPAAIASGTLDVLKAP